MVPAESRGVPSRGSPEPAHHPGAANRRLEVHLGHFQRRVACGGGRLPASHGPALHRRGAGRREHPLPVPWLVLQRRREVRQGPHGHWPRGGAQDVRTGPLGRCHLSRPSQARPPLGVPQFGTWGRCRGSSGRAAHGAGVRGHGVGDDRGPRGLRRVRGEHLRPIARSLPAQRHHQICTRPCDTHDPVHSQGWQHIWQSRFHTRA
mmetsp:Transcript_127212/g.354213  ORF Transcript_127212/g.354213 Transcript_127212/m.354213 type:complete len:205 (-) Transcript_127212:437-1051(-)